MGEGGLAGPFDLTLLVAHGQVLRARGLLDATLDQAERGDLLEGQFLELLEFLLQDLHPRLDVLLVAQLHVLQRPLDLQKLLLPLAEPLQGIRAVRGITVLPVLVLQRPQLACSRLRARILRRHGHAVLHDLLLGH
eukprot:4474607-Pyramimonas_sp.AAC.1